MEIIDYFSCADKDRYIKQIEQCEWVAAKFLAELLRENRLQETLGGWAKLFLLADGDRLVSFVTFSAQDCIDDCSITPWLGFYHTAPEYRGHRHGKALLDYACKYACQEGFDTVYIATDHINLYEKYGFEYIGNRIDIYNEDSRMYKKRTSGI